jgi:pimeloyl-ACP methyl ester carboxylesterase
MRVVKRVLRIAAIPLALYVMLVIAVWWGQRSLLFFPSHTLASTSLTPWRDDNQHIIGYCREVTNAQNIWLMTHGNAGQAADRDYVLSRMSARDSLYVLEYPGYGQRPGTPSLESINQAASEAYQLLRSRNTNTPICVLGESIGTGPACALAQEKPAPDKIVLVVPFDILSNVAAERFYFLPVRLLLRDRWDNIESLKDYAGPVDIFGAARDEIIPVAHAKALAKQVPKARFTQITAGHNDWSASTQVEITR